jgi:hypothetical protein
MQRDIIEELIAAFRVIAFIGFLAMGVMTTGAVYALLAKHFPDKFVNKRWPFIPVSLIVFSILLYIYNFLF